VRHETLDIRLKRIDNYLSVRFIAYCLLPIAYCFFLSSCFKEKLLSPPNNQNRGQVAVIEMGPQYNDQFFYSLATNTVLKRNSRFAYDLMFDCAPNQFHIWLNTGKFMSVKRTDKTDLDSVQLSDTLHGVWHYEFGAFNPDSNAIGQWWDSAAGPSLSAGKVYLLQMGVDNDGNPFGYVKFKVNNFFGDSYSITYSNFVNPSQTISIQKNDNYSYRYLSLTGTGSFPDIEPTKANWDLCFTRYSVFFYAPYNIPYQVTGVLHNPSRVSAYMDSTTVFDSVGISTFNESRLLTRRDAIGYEWKRYSSLSQDGQYSMNRHYTYYIKTDEGVFYKLRFFDFEKNGIRGYPSFEYYPL